MQAELQAEEVLAMYDVRVYRNLFLKVILQKKSSEHQNWWIRSLRRE